MQFRIDSQLTAIYRRVSTDHQDGSLQVQEKRVLDYCAFKGLATSPNLMFSDPDTSGRTPMQERDGGRCLLNRLRAGDIRHLVVAKLDRLGRNVRDALGVLELLRDHNIVLHITDFGGETISTQGHMGRLILTVLLAVAEWEAEEIRDRTLKRMRFKFEHMQLTGKVPYGFDCCYTFADGFEHISTYALRLGDAAHPAEPLVQELTTAHGTVLSKVLVDNPAEQAVIREVAGLRRAGMKLYQIAELLNSRGLRTKLGCQWGPGNVDSILNNRHSALVLQAPAVDQAA